MQKFIINNCAARHKSNANYGKGYRQYVKSLQKFAFHVELLRIYDYIIIDSSVFLNPTRLQVFKSVAVKHQHNQIRNDVTYYRWPFSVWLFFLKYVLKHFFLLRHIWIIFVEIHWLFISGNLGLALMRRRRYFKWEGSKRSIDVIEAA